MRHQVIIFPVLLIVIVGVIGTAGMIALLGAHHVAAQSGDAYIALSPEDISVAMGSVFGVDITVSATGSVPVQEAQVFLNFDPEFLRIVPGGHSTGPLTPGTAFADTSKYSSQSVVDHTTGQIDFTALANSTGSAVSVPFVLASIQFQAVSATPPEGTDIRFSTASPRQTRLQLAGSQETKTGQRVTVRVVQSVGEAPSNVESGVKIEPTPSAGDSQPVTESTSEVPDKLGEQVTDSDEASFEVLPTPPAGYSQLVTKTTPEHPDELGALVTESDAAASGLIETPPLSPGTFDAAATAQPEESAPTQNLDSTDTSDGALAAQTRPVGERNIVKETSSNSTQVWLFPGLGLLGLVGLSVMGGALWRHQYYRRRTWSNREMDQAYDELFRNFKSLKP